MRQIAIPAGLIALGLVPAAAGLARLAQLAAGERLADNARFFDAPLPVVLHILAILIFAFLGALQFVPRFRQSSWHRRAGWLVLPAGLIAAATGIWMTLTYDLPATDSAMLNAIRLVVGAAMLAELLLGLRAVLRRDYVTHRAWMIRAWALGMGAGTQVFTHLPWFLAFGGPEAGVRTWLMAAGWAINAALAEAILRRGGRAAGQAAGRSGVARM